MQALHEVEMGTTVVGGAGCSQSLGRGAPGFVPSSRTRLTKTRAVSTGPPRLLDAESVNTAKT